MSRIPTPATIEAAPAASQKKSRSRLPRRTRRGTAGGRAPSGAGPGLSRKANPF